MRQPHPPTPYVWNIISDDWVYFQIWWTNGNCVCLQLDQANFLMVHPLLCTWCVYIQFKRKSLISEKSFFNLREKVWSVKNVGIWDQLIMLHYPDVYQPSKPVILQQTRVPNSLPMGVNYVDYEPQGTEVIQACLQTTP